MKQHPMPASWLKSCHWEDLANLHVELRFLRHRLILSMNEKIARQGVDNLENLEHLARVDELLCAADAALENAKTILFNICYEQNPSNPDGESKS